MFRTSPSLQIQLMSGGSAQQVSGALPPWRREISNVNEGLNQLTFFSSGVLS